MHRLCTRACFYFISPYYCFCNNKLSSECANSCKCVSYSKACYLGGGGGGGGVIILVDVENWRAHWSWAQVSPKIKPTIRFVNESGTFWPKANLVFNRHINSTPHNSVPLMRKKKCLREHLARMSTHIFLHAWSSHSDTLEIRIHHNLTPGHSLSVLHHWSFSCGTRKFCQRGSGPTLQNWQYFLGWERGSKYH